MSVEREAPTVNIRSLAARWAFLFGAWCLMSRHAPADLAMGALAAYLAAASSVSLWPPDGRLPRPGALLRFIARFLTQTLIAGIATARFAFARRPLLRPAILRLPTRCGDGFTRDAFLAVTSLQPGTMPLGTQGSFLLVHCLDRNAPNAAQLAQDERIFLAVGDR